MMRLACLLALSLAACGSSQEPVATPKKGKMGKTMTDHFTAIVSVQKAVIRGDLANAKLRAKQFTETLRDDDHPAGWHPYLQKVRGAVFQIAAAPDLGQVAAATAKAARTCGACHDALGIDVFTDGAPPPATRPENLSEYMMQHLAAADSMWNGLVGPSPSAWNEGAQTLAGAGLFPQTGSVELTLEMRELGIELNKLGQQATKAEDLHAQSVLYGEFLGTCARCHKLYLSDMD